MELLSNLLKDYGAWGLILIVLIFVVLKSNINIKLGEIEFIFPNPKKERNIKN